LQDLCVDLDVLGLVSVDIAAHIGLFDHGMKKIPCQKPTACPPPGKLPTLPGNNKPSSSHKPPTHKPTCTTQVVKTVTKQHTKTITKQPTKTIVKQLTKTITKQHTNTITVPAAAPTHIAKPPRCTPGLHKRSLVDADLCLNLSVGGLIDLDLATDLNILGHGHKVSCGSGCGIPTWVPARGLVDVVSLLPLALLICANFVE
jgi:hypothetical protein